tara:strand:- start:880 stop:1407 length:528 start_codon:yes stop_codon:yes gene_type:complete
MWKSNKHGDKVNMTKKVDSKIETLIGSNVVIDGDVKFKEGLHISGVVKGNVSLLDNEQHAMLIIDETGHVEGEINVPKVIVHGQAMGRINSTEYLELGPNSTVFGDVCYNLLEISKGAEIRGALEPKHVKNLGLRDNSLLESETGVIDTVSRPLTSDSSTNFSKKSNISLDEEVV